MARVKETYDVEVKGTGRRDNLGKIVSDRVKTFKEVTLLPNELIKTFSIVFSDVESLFPWVNSPLAIGSTAHLIDNSTNLPMPYVVPGGYELKIIRLWSSIDQPVLAELYVNTQMASNLLSQVGGVYFEQEIEEFTTKDLDPTFTTAALMDFVGQNAGYDYAYGTAVLSCLLIRHGTEPYEEDTKIAKCRVCGEEKRIPYDATSMKCSQGHETRFYVYRWGGV